MDELNGKVAVVTGAASGIGLAMAKRFGAEGMRVVMADIEQNALAKSADEVREGGVADVLAVPTDVSRFESVEALAEATKSAFGSWHVVCNNAGVLRLGGTAWETSPELWTWTLGVNLMGVVHGVRAFMPDMVERNEGHMVNTSSAAAFNAVPGSAPYTVSKYGVLGLSEGMYHELDFLGSDVGVSVLLPGQVNTAIHEAGRNWPEELGARPPEAEYMLRHELVRGTGQDPTMIAELVLDAIRNKRFWIHSAPASMDAYVARTLAAQRGENPPFRE